MKREIEILVGLESNKEDALDVLKRFNFKGLYKTLDVYFYHPENKKFKPDENGRLLECSRIRKKKDKNYLTYKKDYFNNNNKWLYSDEYEIEISDFEIGKAILNNHGFHELITVDCEKYIFTNNEYEIAMEDVKGLGLFLEVEIIKDIEERNVIVEKNKIIDFIKSLNLKITREMNSGKPELLINKYKKEQKKIFISYKFTKAEKIAETKIILDLFKSIFLDLSIKFYCSLDDSRYFEKNQYTDMQRIKYINEKLSRSDALILIITDENESKGMLLEIGYALAQKIAIILFIKKGVGSALERNISDKIIEFENLEELSNLIKNQF